MSTALPPQLHDPIDENGTIVTQLVLDLTAYLVGPTVDELDAIIDLYQQVCPKDRITVYALEETEDWDFVDDPMLTRLGREAEARGLPLPFVEVVRQRIRDGRRFTLQFWDEKAADSYSMAIRRVLVDDEHHAFVRFILPVDVEPQVLRALAVDLTDHVRVHSGHGGYCLAYDPWEKHRAFTLNYGRAKRWWGLDLEDLNGTLPLMHARVKGAQWITILSPHFANHPEVAPRLGDENPLTRRTVCTHGTVITAGNVPTIGDQHQPDPGLDAYASVGRALAPITVDQHPDFDGVHFTGNGDTVAWFRRFIEPNDWR